jgi:hypothetical protein
VLGRLARLSLIVWSLALVSLTVASLLPPVPGAGRSRDLGGSLARAADPGSRIYLPVVARADPIAQESGLNSPRLGVWIGGGDQSVIDQLAASGAKWTRIILLWSTVEPTKGTYSFAAYDDTLRRLKSAGVGVVLEIRRNPAWAAPTQCGPIDDLDAFEAFVRATVARYSGSEFGVRHFEFYNEPDCRFESYGGENTGCFGDHPEAYAQMLARAYRGAKSVDPTVAVVFGGLAYDVNLFADCGPGGCFNTSFFDQVLSQSFDGRPLGEYFDVANVHYFSSQGPHWTSYGHDVSGKVASLRAVMAKHGIAKPVALTEVSWTTDYTLEHQARYVPKVIARGAAANLYMTLWFCLSEWPSSTWPYGLVYQSGLPRDSYKAYQIAAREIGQSTSVRTLAASEVGAETGVEGYAVGGNGPERLILWARKDGGTDGGDSQAAITIPASATAAFDKLGGSIPLRSGGTPYTLTDDPIYVRY